MVNSKLYWTLEKCINNASQYSTKKEWRKNSPGAYLSSYRNGWHDKCCNHMVKLGSLMNRLIYSFEFSDKSVYIGLTYNSENRINRHFNDKRSQVFRYIKSSGLEPSYKELTSFLILEDAVNAEERILQKYKTDGWNILNVNKTGGLGGNIIKWTKENCILDAKKYNSRVEWSDNSTGYDVARKFGWLSECCKHMIRPIVHNKKWTLEACKNEALKFTKRSDWYNKSRSSYVTAVRNKWLDVCGSHFKSL